MKGQFQKTDLIAFSDVKWNSSFSRTSQIMSRFASYRRVYFFEAPILGISKTPLYLLRETRDDVIVVESYLPEGLSVFEKKSALLGILRKFLHDEKISKFTAWTDSPKSMSLIRPIAPDVLIYDCQDDYSKNLPDLEKQIFEMADLVLTSSFSLYTAKKHLHTNIHHNPDNLDYRHFFQSRSLDDEADDMEHIPHPRIGFGGALDDKVDYELVQHVSALHPEWQFVFLGEIKIDQEFLPRASNIHYLGHKSYNKLPLYLAGLDAAFVPYKVNEGNRFLNPVFIAEALVAGLPVVSTPLPDVVTMYEGQNLIHLAEFPHDISRSILLALAEKKSALWIHHVDKTFQGSSWEKCRSRLAALENDVYVLKNRSFIPLVIHGIFNSVARPNYR